MPNVAPTGTDLTFERDPDGPGYQFADVNFGFNDADGNNFIEIIIESLPSSGRLEYNGDPVTVGMRMSPFDLFYYHDDGVTGLVSFQFRVVDDGGNTNGNDDTSDSVNTLTFDFGGQDISGALAVNEGAANGTMVGTLVASDISLPLTWSLLENAGGRFTIDPATGVVKVANRLLLDREQAATHNIKVQVTDGTTSHNEIMAVVVGDVTPENMTGDGGKNKFVGGSGKDIFKGGGDKDTIDGGAGLDTADYSDKSQTVKVTLSGGTYADVYVGGTASGDKEDKIRLIENVIGGSKDDTLTGDGSANVFRGMAGKDVLDGGAGIDTADYSEKNKKVVVTLNGATQVDVSVDGVKEDKIKNFENVTGGSAADTLKGDAKANVLSGNNGADILSGGGGKDTLIGGLGNDKLTGDAAADVFRFTTALNSASNLDHITDFSTAGGDEIELDDAIFVAIGSSLTADEFLSRASGNAATNTLQHLIYDKKTGTLWYDATGSTNGATDAIKFAVLDNKPATLGIGDFDMV